MAWVVLILGAIAGIFFSMATGVWGIELLIVFFSFLLGAAILFGILVGISEILRFLEEQNEISRHIQADLKKLIPIEEPPTEPRHCAKCGTQLPPGGSVCPTCHHMNS